MKLIVAAIDFSPAASPAMRRADRLAAACGRLALLHVARHRSAWARVGWRGTSVWVPASQTSANPMS